MSNRVLPSGGWLFPRPSSVNRCIVRNLVLMLTGLCAIALSVDDFCKQANFGDEFLTFGPVNDNLLLFINNTSHGPDWNWYNLSSSALNVSSLNLVGSATTRVSDKWGYWFNQTDQLNISESAVLLQVDMKEKGNHYGLLQWSFNSNSSKFKFYDLFDTVLQNITTKDFVRNGLWISSDETDTFYELSSLGHNISQCNLNYSDGELSVSKGNTSGICKIDKCGSELTAVRITQEANCTNLDWTVDKGFRYQNRFYLFGSQRVYIFDATEAFKVGGCSTVQNVTYEQFVQCDPPPPPTTSTTTSNSSTETTGNSSTTTTTAQTSDWTSTFHTSDSSPSTVPQTYSTIEWTSSQFSTEDSSPSLEPDNEFSTKRSYIHLYQAIVAVIFVIIVVVLMVYLANRYCRNDTSISDTSTERKKRRLRSGKPRSNGQPPPPPPVASDFGRLSSSIMLDINIDQPSLTDMDAPNGGGSIRLTMNQNALKQSSSKEQLIMAKHKPTSAQAAVSPKRQTSLQANANRPQSRGNVIQPRMCSPKTPKPNYKCDSVQWAPRDSHSESLMKLIEAGQPLPKKTKTVGDNLAANNIANNLHKGKQIGQ